jgi:hypothetical protein
MTDAEENGVTYCFGLDSSEAWHGTVIAVQNGTFEFSLSNAIT